MMMPTFAKNRLNSYGFRDFKIVQIIVYEAALMRFYMVASQYIFEHFRRGFGTPVSKDFHVFGSVLIDETTT